MRKLPRLPALLLGLLVPLGAGCAVDRAALVEHLEASAYEPQTSGATASLRGVCAVDPQVCWASGGGGTVLRTLDGGATWASVPIPGAEDLDFRDVHALDGDRAWVLSAGLPARIYRTIDGGRSWLLQHEDLRDGVFFDALEFRDERRALAFSDPVDGHLLIVRTDDEGATWTAVDADGIPAALVNEAGFAASGTCLAVRGRRLAWIGLGGDTGEGARVFRTSDGGRTWHVVETPMISGQSAGVFSLAFRDDRNGIAVGGNYREPDDARGNAMVTADGGVTWVLAGIAPPRGYRSVVRWVDGLGAPVAIAAGPTGSDFTVDGGQTWHALDDTGYHSLSLVPGRPVGWAVGANGRIARLRLSGSVKGAAGAILLLVVVSIAGCASAPDAPPGIASRAAGATPTPGYRALGGYSVEGRAIEVEILGHGPERVLIIASIHGNEPAGTPLVRALRERLVAEPERLDGRTVILVPVANPDGLAAGRRRNARGVDLNRDFPSSNRRARPRSAAPPRPEAQPETRSLIDLVDEHAPDRIVSIHQPLACIDYDGAGEDLARLMAGASDLRVRKLGARPGSLGAWAGEDRGIAVVTLELPGAASRAADESLWRRYGPMLLAFVEGDASPAVASASEEHPVPGERRPVE